MRFATVSLTALSAALLCVSTLNAQGRPYRMRVYFDRTYNTAAALKQTDSLASLLLPTQIVVDHRKSIAQLISDTYGFGKKKPELYEHLYAAIVRLNGLDPDRDVTAGKTLLVPTAPYWSPPVGFSARDRRLGWNHESNANRVALASEAEVIRLQRSVADSVPGVAGNGLFALSPDWRSTYVDRKNSKAAAITLEFRNPRTVTNRPQALTRFGMLSDGPFEIRLDGAAGRQSSDSDDDAYDLLPAERTAIDAAAARAAAKNTTVPLVILDFEWPNLAEAQRSADWLYGILSAERVARHWKPITAPRIPVTMPLSRFPHSAAIDDALTHLTERDMGKAVGVYYVPLVAAPGADTVLVDLVATYFASREAVRTGTTVSLDSAYVEASRLVHDLPTTVGTDEGSILSTTRVLMDALLYVLDQNARRTLVPYVLNASWILSQPISIGPALSAPVSALIVAATGNLNEDVVEQSRDLARWSNEGRLVLSVENFSSAGKPTCSSSTFADSSGAVLLRTVVAYRGGRASAGPYRCGTSFSAPRVGWFMALRFATEGAIAKKSLPSWSTTAWNNVRRAAHAGSGVPVFDPAALLQP